MKLFHKLLISVLTAVLIIFAAIGYISYTENTKILESEIEKRALALLETNIAKLGERIENLQSLAATVAIGYEAFGPATEDEIKMLIRGTLDMVPYAYGSTIAFKPTDEGGLFAPYYFRTGKDLKYMNLTSTEYNYPEKDWFKRPFIAGTPLWSAPYVDVGAGNTAMMTYSYPVRKNKVIEAIATSDVSLRELTKVVDEIKVGTTGRAILVGKDGMILAMPEDKWEFKRTVFDAAKELKMPQLDTIGKEMIAGKSGFARMADPLTKKDGWIVYGPVPQTGWSLSILIPEEELMAGIESLHHHMLIVGGIGIILLVVILYAINKTITKPLTHLTDSARRIASGDYDVHLAEIAEKGEVGTLARSLAEMKDSLLHSIDNLYQAQNIGGAAIEALPDAILIMDTNWQIKHNNAAAQSLFTLPVDGSFLDAITTSFESSLDRTQLGTISRESVTFTLTRREDDQATPRVIACSATPIYNKTGNLTHYVMSARSAEL